jgi:hypothetical protein
VREDEWDRPLEDAAAEQARREEARLFADAAALDRLASMDEWQVLDRLMAEHADRALLALRARGLGMVETEALRVELDLLDWLRYRPIALRRAVEERTRLTRPRESGSSGG